MNQQLHTQGRKKERKWTRTTDLQACTLGALKLGEGSHSATLAQSLASPLDGIFETVFCEFGGTRWKKKGLQAAGRCRESAGMWSDSKRLGSTLTLSTCTEEDSVATFLWRPPKARHN